MIGAIAGDIIGSVYERHPIKTVDFPLFHPRCRFTDDSVLTVAIAYAILNEVDYATALKTFGRKYPRAGYGGAFLDWIFAVESRPYNSWGNGAAMRVSPVGFAFPDVDRVLSEAQRSAEVSHNHPEGIKGAQATALAVFLARQGESKASIRREITQRFGYNLQRTVAEIRPRYHFDVSCQGTVPEAIIAFLDSKDYVETIRNAISLGGDSDTLACIAGGIAQAFYQGIPDDILKTVYSMLPEEFTAIIGAFNHAYGL
jgi:ADP-ribosylglycohydrolase